MEKLRPYLSLLLICVGMAVVQQGYGLCPQDDAFISFRYAANLADGHGLVFNPGERVEGYTNFLWTLIFAPVIGLGLDPVPVSTSLGMVFTLLLLWSSWELSGRRWLVPLLVACFPGLSLEGVQGLETVAFAFFVCQALRGEKHWALWAGLAALTRPEGYAVFGLLWIWRRDWRSAALFSAFTVPHLFFRVAYYGDIVPNTFHAKVGGSETLQGSALSRGLEYLGHQVVDLRWEQPQPHLAVVSLLLLWGLFSVLRKGRPGLPASPQLRDSLCLSLFYIAYIALVGGDFKGTGRFVIPILAPLSVLAVESIFVWLEEDGGEILRKGVAVVALGCAIPGLGQMSDFAEHFHRTWLGQRAVAEFLGSQDWPEAEYELAIHGAGIIPYYSGLRSLDLWGLNDAHIAQAESEDFGSGRAGHERSDYAYALSRAPLLILPEPDVTLPYPGWAFPLGPEGDIRDPVLPAYPQVFGEEFEELYRPLVASCESCEEGQEWVHFWVLRSAILDGSVERKSVPFVCEQPCDWSGPLMQLVYMPRSG
jgi:hypothetical protein